RLGETCTHHRVDVDDFVCAPVVPFTSLLIQNSGDGALGGNVGNDGDAARKKCREVMEGVPPLANESGNGLPMDGGFLNERKELVMNQTVSPRVPFQLVNKRGHHS